MTEEQAIKGLKENLCSLCAYGSQNMDSCDIRECDNRDYIKALERQSSEDCVSREQALLQLTGVNLSDKTTKELIGLIGRRIQSLPPVTPKLSTSEDCVSRQMVKKGMIKYGFRAPDMTVTEFIEDELPPVIPTHGTCKECKYSSVHTISLDKIDEIRVCRIQFSKQIKDDYYCANYEKRGSENE